MEYAKTSLPEFWVIGREGSTDDGDGFIGLLWEKANSTFAEVSHLALTGENGSLRVWGLMSDMAMTFRPWEDDFTRGRYLAGVEVPRDAIPPEGWVKWHSPAYEYIVASADAPDAFPRAIEYISANDLSLAGACYDLTVPGEGSYIYLPIKKL